MSKERFTCKDYYGVRIRKGSIVALFNDKTAEKLKVISITQTAQGYVLILEKSDKTLKEGVCAKECYLFDDSRIAIKRRMKKWIARDIPTKQHIYTKYHDAGGIILAEGMVLQSAFDELENRYLLYYVAKDKETKQYYLQCFADLAQIETQEDRIKSIKQNIEKAEKCYDVQPHVNGVPMFLEDYGLKLEEF